MRAFGVERVGTLEGGKSVLLAESRQDIGYDIVSSTPVGRVLIAILDSLIK